LVSVLDFLEVQYLGVHLVVEEIMGVGEEEDKQMELTQSFLAHFLEEVLEVVTVEEKEGKHQEKN